MPRLAIGGDIQMAMEVAMRTRMLVKLHDGSLVTYAACSAANGWVSVTTTCAPIPLARIAIPLPHQP